MKRLSMQNRQDMQWMQIFTCPACSKWTFKKGLATGSRNRTAGRNCAAPGNVNEDRSPRNFSTFQPFNFSTRFHDNNGGVDSQVLLWHCTRVYAF